MRAGGGSESLLKRVPAVPGVGPPMGKQVMPQPLERPHLLSPGDAVRSPPRAPASQAWPRLFSRRTKEGKLDARVLRIGFHGCGNPTSCTQGAKPFSR